jgi:hypothetical protein
MARKRQREIPRTETEQEGRKHSIPGVRFPPLSWEEDEIGVRDLANIVEVTVASVEITDVGFVKEDRE